MGRTRRKKSRLKIGKEKLCTESGGEQEARKTENAMGGQCKERSGMSGGRMENNCKR